MARLNLGAGAWKLEGWTNWDKTDLDLSLFPWALDNDAYDEILLSHVLEHFTRGQAHLVLLQCHRILRPDGWLHIAVPDMDKFIDCRLSGNYDALGGYRWTSLDSFMGGGEEEHNPDQRHRYMWCNASLHYTLERCGFDNITHRYTRREWDNPAYEAFSLYMDAQK